MSPEEEPKMQFKNLENILDFYFRLNLSFCQVWNVYVMVQFVIQFPFFKLVQLAEERVILESFIDSIEDENEYEIWLPIFSKNI